MKKPNRRSFLIATSGIATVALAGCSGGGDGGDGGDSGDGGDGSDGGSGGGTNDRIDSFLSDNDANLYEGSVEDLTGQDSVTVEVGAGDQGYAFDPAAFRIDTGTTVVWEWTGSGGQHNVVPDGDSDFSDFGESELIQESGHTVEATFDESGVGLYACEPHISLGMVGGFVVD